MGDIYPEIIRQFYKENSNAKKEELFMTALG